MDCDSQYCISTCTKYLNVFLLYIPKDKIYFTEQYKCRLPCWNEMISNGNKLTVDAVQSSENYLETMLNK